MTCELGGVRLKAAPRSSVSSPRLLGAAPTPIEGNNGRDASGGQEQGPPCGSAERFGARSAALRAARADESIELAFRASALGHLGPARRLEDPVDRLPRSLDERERCPRGFGTLHPRKHGGKMNCGRNVL
jgi:hypothetical protein